MLKILMFYVAKHELAAGINNKHILVFKHFYFLCSNLIFIMQ